MNKDISLMNDILAFSSNSREKYEKKRRMLLSKNMVRENEMN